TQHVLLRNSSRLAGRRTTPPPVAMTERASSTSVASMSDSRSRNACSPLAAKKSAIEQPARRSIAWSQSAYDRARRFAVALPMADLPLPGIPISAIGRLGQESVLAGIAWGDRGAVGRSCVGYISGRRRGRIFHEIVDPRGTDDKGWRRLGRRHRGHGSGQILGPLPRPSAQRTQRAAVRSVMSLGVRKISNSVLLEVVVRVLKRLPRYGTSPSQGTLVMSSRSCCSKMPPMTTVPPFSTRTCVLTCLVLIAKPAVVARPTLSLVMSTSRMTLPSRVTCGVTSSLRLALRNCSDVAPL